MTDRSKLRPLVAVRVAVGLLLLLHGVARVRLGIVDDFGVFLSGEGLPAGPALAWTVTVVELVGGPLLVWGRGVRVLAPWFALQLVAGIVLVHAAEGWFVVGAGRNGVEYSVLLVVCLGAVVADSFRD